MKFKVLKKVDKGRYKVTCSLPMSFFDLGSFSRDLEKLKEYYCYDRLVLSFYGSFAGKKFENSIGDILIWDGSNESQKNLLTLGVASDIDKEFIEMREQRITDFEMYISVDSPEGNGTAD